MVVTKNPEKFTLDQVVFDVREELERATSIHGPFYSPHEGYAVLLEEVDELWDEIKKGKGRSLSYKGMTEAIQVAAMAMRLAMDLYYAKPKE